MFTQIGKHKWSYELLDDKDINQFDQNKIQFYISKLTKLISKSGRVLKLCKSKKNSPENFIELTESYQDHLTHGIHSKIFLRSKYRSPRDLDEDESSSSLILSSDNEEIDNEDEDDVNNEDKQSRKLIFGSIIMLPVFDSVKNIEVGIIEIYYLR